MKNFTFLLLGTMLLALSCYAQSGFTSVTKLNPITVSAYTKDKPQAKVWTYAGKWWAVLSVSGNTKIFRLDGTSWTSVLTLASGDPKPDTWVVDNVVHLLLYKGASTNSYIYSVEYDPAANTYRLWSKRPKGVALKLPSGSETATLTVDGNGRMWVSTTGTSSVYVWWSDAPYSTWSAPVTIGTGIDDDDISAITSLPSLGKIGVLWSNQKTKRFGFKTHSNDASPSTWSADEVPASQSALSKSNGMADDHMNIQVASNGTLYASVKTSYDASGYPQLGLLVRRPNGSWDNLYTVTTYNEGTQPVLIYNEVLGKLKVVYTTKTDGGNIVYRESSTSNISFGSTKTLISGALYNYATSTHQRYNPDIVILATNVSSSSKQAAGVLCSDGASSLTANTVSTLKTPVEQSSSGVLFAYPNPFSNSSTLNFTLEQTGDYTLAVYDAKGTKVSVLKQGRAEAGVQNSISIDGASWASGIYWVKLQTDKGTQTLKLLLKK